jgi:hypothetical protein
MYIFNTLTSFCNFIMSRSKILKYIINTLTSFFNFMKSRSKILKHIINTLTLRINFVKSRSNFVNLRSNKWSPAAINELVQQNIKSCSNKWSVCLQKQYYYNINIYCLNWWEYITLLILIFKSIIILIVKSA